MRKPVATQDPSRRVVLSPSEDPTVCGIFPRLRVSQDPRVAEPQGLDVSRYVRSASWPAVGPSSAALLRATRACCAYTMSRSLESVTADSRCFRANRAAQSTRGNSVSVM